LTNFEEIFRGVRYVIGNKWLDFGHDLERDADPVIFLKEFSIRG